MKTPPVDSGLDRWVPATEGPVIVSEPTRIGSVPYLNSVPLTDGIEERCLFLPPSALAARLEDGSLDVALVSVTEALFRPGFRIVDDVAIASDGPVYSVFLAHREPLERLRTVHLDPASCTSVNLLRILLAARGWHPETRPLASYDRGAMPDNALLIGNPAIEFARGPRDHQILDLGEEWRRLTGLPFVYAVWAVRESAVTAGLAQELRAAKTRGMGRLPHWVEARTEFDRDFRRAYLGGHIRYGLGPREKAGLERFRQELERHTGRPTWAPRYF